MTDSDAPRASSIPLSPTKRNERILALDAARGLAILGVFCVNVQVMAMPLAEIFSPKIPDGASTLDIAAWAFTKIFCEGKFYPLFSMLFGMGFILLIDRARAKGVSPVPLYARRILILFAFGALHVILLWYGDILLMYSLCAIGLLLARNASARVLAILGAIFLGLSVLTAVVGMLLMPVPEAADEGGQASGEVLVEPGLESDPPEPAPASDSQAASPFRYPIDPNRSPAEQLWEGLDDDPSVLDDATAWAELETRATREGPFSEALVFRLIHYLMFLTFALPFGFGPSILAMFFFGAAIMRSKALENPKFLLKGVVLGMTIGLPSAVLFLLIGTRVSQETAGYLAALAYATYPVVSLMYLSAIAMLARSTAKGLPKLLAPVGRMALTNYLMDSLAFAIITHHWGFALFATLSRAEMLGLVFAIFLAQIALSHLWLRFFRFGPMEWIWRSLTYLRIQPMRKTPPQDAML